MINKLYEFFKKIIKENILSILVFIVLSIIFLLPIPYYIDMPGGLLNTDDRIKIENEYKIKGSYNMTYVSEIKATPILYLISKINPNWDLVSIKQMEESGLTIEELNIYNKLLLNDANNTAVSIAYTKAGKDISILKNDFIVVHVSSDDTNLKAGDRIVGIDGKEVKSFDEIKEIINKRKANDILRIDVKNDDKKVEKYAKVYSEDNELLIGIVILSDIDLDANPKYKFNFDKKESGPSGGLMMTLTIYNKLIDKDLTKGRIISGTGAISLDGTVSSIGGVKYKLKGAVKNHADVFLVPSGENYEEAIKLKEKYNYDIEIVSISNFKEALNYLENN